MFATVGDGLADARKALGCARHRRCSRRTQVERSLECFLFPADYTYELREHLLEELMSEAGVPMRNISGSYRIATEHFEKAADLKCRSRLVPLQTHMAIGGVLAHVRSGRDPKYGRLVVKPRSTGFQSVLQRPPMTAREVAWAMPSKWPSVWHLDALRSTRIVKRRARRRCRAKSFGSRSCNRRKTGMARTSPGAPRPRGEAQLV